MPIHQLNVSGIPMSILLLFPTMVTLPPLICSTRLRLELFNETSATMSTLLEEVAYSSHGKLYLYQYESRLLSPLTYSAKAQEAWVLA